MRATTGVIWFVLGALIMLLIAEDYISNQVDQRVNLGLWAAQRSDYIKAGRYADKN